MRSGSTDVYKRQHLTHKIQHGGLVGGVEGLAPQEGETFDIGLFQRLEDLTGLGLGEGLAVGEVPGLRVEACLLYTSH